MVEAQRRGDRPLDGFEEAQHRIHWMVLVLLMNSHQGLVLLMQTMRLETTEGPVLQMQTVHLGRTTAHRAVRVPERALSRR